MTANKTIKSKKLSDALRKNLQRRKCVQKKIDNIKEEK